MYMCMCDCLDSCYHSWFPPLYRYNNDCCGICVLVYIWEQHTCAFLWVYVLYISSLSSVPGVTKCVCVYVRLYDMLCLNGRGNASVIWMVLICAGGVDVRCELLNDASKPIITQGDQSKRHSEWRNNLMDNISHRGKMGVCACLFF